MTPTTVALIALLALGCVTKEDAKKAIDAIAESKAATMPDQLPVMQNQNPPFRYPASLVAAGVTDTVVLRLFIDSTGVVHDDSTRVEHASRYPVLDSAALTGARALTFTPASRAGRPMSVSIKLPVQFNPPTTPKKP